MKTTRILVINPGSTSTKLAYYEDGVQVYEKTVDHPAAELTAFPDIASQRDYRTAFVMEFLREWDIEPSGLDAVSARGGLMKPVESGVYSVTRRMVEDLERSRARWGREHASSLGCMIALDISKRFGVPAFTADPVTVDEMDEVARVSGVPEISRKSHLHALNIKAVVRTATAESCTVPEEANYVVAHAGGGISVAAVRGGRIVDVNNALLGMGPFSPQRAGALPIGDLVGLVYSSGLDRDEIERKLIRKSGLAGYLGTSDAREVELRIAGGDELARLVYQAMAYQLAKEIAAMAAVLHGDVHAVLLTGGLAHSEYFVEMVSMRAGFIAQVRVYPGEHEMDSLAYYAAAALAGEEEVKDYGDGEDV
jgi:butyrate kinase